MDRVRELIGTMEIRVRPIDQRPIGLLRQRPVTGAIAQMKLQVIPVRIDIVGKQLRDGHGQRLVFGDVKRVIRGERRMIHVGHLDADCGQSGIIMTVERSVLKRIGAGVSRRWCVFPMTTP